MSRTTLLLALGGGCVVLLAVALALLAQASRGDVLRRRVTAIAAPHRRAVSPAAARERPAAKAGRRVLALLARLVALRLERTSHFPMRWWLVPIVALPVARAGCGLAAALLGDAALLAVPLVWLALVRAAYRSFEQARLDRLYRQLPDALAMIVRAARVGIPVAEAIRTVAREAPEPTAQEFRDLADRLALGLPLADALAITARNSGLPEYGFFATALILQNQTGGGLAETLENLADVIRRRVQLRARAHALAAEARTSALILMLLPAVAAAALLVVSPDYVRLLWADQAGQQIAAVALAMIATGGCVMRSIIRRSLA